jgi:hypothetical protein
MAVRMEGDSSIITKWYVYRQQNDSIVSSRRKNVTEVQEKAVIYRVVVMQGRRADEWHGHCFSPR